LNSFTVFDAKSSAMSMIAAPVCRSVVASGVLHAFEEDFRLGRLVAVEIELAAVIQRAEELSERHATAYGHRAFDTLHVATALVLGFGELLTFDIQQRALAEAEHLAVPW
jgi:predicted nucleic acid-binding protein